MHHRNYSVFNFQLFALCIRVIFLETYNHQIEPVCFDFDQHNSRSTEADQAIWKGGVQQMQNSGQLTFKLFVCGSRRGGGYIGYISKMHLKIHTGKASPSFPRKTKLYGPYLIKILGLSYCLLLSFDKQKTRAFEMNRLI